MKKITIKQVRQWLHNPASHGATSNIPGLCQMILDLWDEMDGAHEDLMEKDRRIKHLEKEIATLKEARKEAGE